MDSRFSTDATNFSAPLEPLVVNGQRTWLKTAFAKTVTHTLPGGKRLSVQAGTQIIDRYWRNLRSRLERHAGKVGSESLRPD